jgi:hypothetical protein
MPWFSWRPESFWTIHWFIDTRCSVASRASRACSDGEVLTTNGPAVAAFAQRGGDFLGPADFPKFRDVLVDGFLDLRDGELRGGASAFMKGTSMQAPRYWR